MMILDSRKTSIMNWKPSIIEKKTKNTNFYKTRMNFLMTQFF